MNTNSKTAQRRRNSPLHGATAGLPDDPSAKLIQLTRGKFTIVDATLFEALNSYNWFADLLDGRFYATRYQGGRKIKMQWQILYPVALHPPAGIHTDHINGNPLDNRCSNLRPVTPGQNSCNRGPLKCNKLGIKGVHFDKRKGKYVAQTSVNDKKVWLGRFATKEAAALAYREAAIRFHGQFARFERFA